ncbi:MAG: hypothetical protein GF308_12590 [Candidatus Heimdallarchaeota archaeon]|nr:hypothetical protein [Candidatus Heimdallarchaeota archaeon]
MDLYANNFYKLNALPVVEINVQPNVLYSEEYSYLTLDELEVLFLFATTEMSSDGLTSFSFSGIKRKLGKHQQKVTKAINRLISKDFINKNSFGYSIAPKGRKILSEIVKLQNAIELQLSAKEFLEQKLEFTEPLPLSQVADLLVGKWFSSFRYISHSGGENLIIRWQIVNSKTSATLLLSPEEGILTIYPSENDHPGLVEKALADFSSFVQESIETALDIQAMVTSQGWQNNVATKIDYQQRLTSWLRNCSKNIPEN